MTVLTITALSFVFTLIATILIVLFAVNKSESYVNKEIDRRWSLLSDDYLAMASEVDYWQAELRAAQHAHDADLHTLREASRLISSDWSVETTADGWTGGDRKDMHFDTAVDMLFEVSHARAAQRCVQYTRVGSLVLSN